MMLDLLRWLPHNRGSTFKFDSAHPVGCSHHQKIVVIDDRLAVCGGIDMTDDRWDTREHLRGRPAAQAPDRRALRAVARLHDDARRPGRRRARRATAATAGSRPAAASSSRARRATARAWPERAGGRVPRTSRSASPAPARSTTTSPRVREIEALFLEQIARAKRFIYAESQYFASRKIAEAIAERLSRGRPARDRADQPA